MFDSTSLDSDDLNASSLGIVAEKELISSEEKNSYFVSFKQDGSYEKIVFTKTISENYSDGTQEVTQEEIEGNAENLYINEKFIFMSFTANTPDPFAAKYPSFHSNDSTKVFLVDRKTGKMYSLNDFSSFKVVETSVIKSGDSYYRLQIDNGALTATDILPNKNIRIYFVLEDKFGNIYAYNDQLESSNGKIFYITNCLFKGKDGCCYDIRGGLYQSYSFPGELIVFRKNSNGQNEECTSLNTTIFFDDDFSIRGYIHFRNTEVYELRENSYNGYLYGAYGYDSFETRGGFRMMKNAYFVDDSIIVGERDDGIYYYDLSSEKKMDGYTGNTSVTFANEGVVMDRGEICSESGEYFVRVEEALGTEVYRLTVKNGKVVPTLFVRTDYDAEVLTIQPLN